MYSPFSPNAQSVCQKSSIYVSLSSPLPVFFSPITILTHNHRVYLVTPPAKFQFCVPRNLKLLAVPLFDLYENTRRYGSVLASLPQSLSRYNLQCEKPRDF